MMDGLGHVEVIIGPMFSGKTEELIRRLKRAALAHQPILTFKPDNDDRYNRENIVSHSKIEFPVTPIPKEHPEWILGYVCHDIRVVGIDEAQFFTDGIVEVSQKLAEMGIRVILSGLDMDFRGEPFGPVPALMAVAERVDKLTAICTICGREATRTQRMTDSTELVDVGADEKYSARCRMHHKVSGIENET